jgi:solute carrier family 36 (proton-coupled amino acid transporter)
MPKVIATKPSIRFSVDVSKNKKRPISISLKTQSTYSIVDGPTLSYCDAMMHYLKGNIGTGCFAFAEAFKNSGLLLGTILAIFISIISLHVQHVLMRCSRLTKNRENLSIQPDYADTIESCFSQSKDPRFHRYAYALKTLCNLSICLTQFGFCCVYILFVSENLHQVFIENGIQIDIKLLQIYIFIPLWMSALIRQLKYIGKFDTF